MESELEKFRRRKQLEEKKEEIKTKLKRTADSWADSLKKALLPTWNESDNDEDDDDDNPQQDDNDNNDNQLNSTGTGSKNYNTKQKCLMYAVIFLRFIAWVLAYIAFIKIGFGAVFFTLSLLIFIYLNTAGSKKRGNRRRKDGLSAYSVFNKDCKSIDGTLKAEHLEKQLLYRN